jgi:hypothetical protein
MKIIIIVIILLCLAPTSPAQNRNLWDWSDAALAGSFIADEASTRSCATCREVGVIKNTGGRTGFKVGLFTAFKLLDWKSPESRTKSRWFKVSIAAVFALVSYKNAKIK